MKKEVFFVNVLGRKGLSVLLLCILLSFLALHSYADNPIISHVYTADPSGYVANGRLYVICSHDLDHQSGYDMYDYYLFSSTDLVTWQDHGIVFDARKDTSWANLAYAPDMAYRNGKYYLFFPDGANAIGVAVSNSPEGPFKDAIGRPLIDRNTPNGNVQWVFDPGIFIDDDGQAYCYFGGGGPGNARVIKVNSDMTSVSGSAVTIDAPHFFEASYMHKRNGIYYFSYSTDFSEGAARIDYMTSDNPMTGFRHRGTVLGNPWNNLGNNNHHSILEYNGQWYIFYHNRAVSNSVYQRSVCLDYLYYNSDGTIQTVNDSQAGVDPVTPGDTPVPTPDPTSTPTPEVLNPGTMYNFEAENAFLSNCTIDTDHSGYSGTGYVNYANEPGGYIEWTVTVSSPAQANLEFIFANAGGADRPCQMIVNGSTTVTLAFPDTGAWANWNTAPAIINLDSGTNTIRLTCTGSEGGPNVDRMDITVNNGSTTPTPFITPGDVNGDGEIDIVDALLIAQYYVDLNPSEFIPGNADTNCDGSIDIVDALLVAQYYVNLISDFC